MTHQVVLQDAANQQWLSFCEPRQFVEIHRIEEVVPGLRLVESLVERHKLYAAGFISYEAAPAFDPALRARVPGTRMPLLWFGLYAECCPSPVPPLLPEQPYTLGEWTPSVSRAAYRQAITLIKKYIARGETYQVNYTFRLRAPFTGSPWRLFLDLYRAQRSQYAAYIDLPGFAICSASPELFFDLNQDRLSARPMKGTAARGRTLAEDKDQAQWLYRSEKNRAENVMIVDMIRNDVGRIAVTGSVRVPHLFSVERYPTVWQMTSTATATTRASLTEILTALFPCASITGAPKARTMQIIASLETSPRSVYTGCIGFMAPGRRAQFNVAIRTVVVDKAAGQAEYGVGGGIVWDSESNDEYEECLVKARLLTERRPEFSLLETLLWTPGHSHPAPAPHSEKYPAGAATGSDGYFLLAYHLRRLEESAAYFDIPLDLERVWAELAALAASLPDCPHRVRLLVTQAGEVSSQAVALGGAAIPQPVRLRLAQAPVDPANPFLYHKTTHRQVYESARAAAGQDCDDVLLWNERGEITEASIFNIVARIGSRLVTPPVQCGLLPGTFRAWLLDRQEIQEEIITLKDLRRCDELYVINSVRKWRKARLLG